MNPFPTLFISHGAPDLPIREGAVTHFLKSLSQQLPKPKAILMVSAHWNAEPLKVSATPNPKTYHDFSGFPEALYQLHYPAPGSPEMADRVVRLLSQSGIACQTHPSRGFDHGVWTPLILAYPTAKIPVVQLSVQYQQSPQMHWRLGQALEPLRREGILIIGSGSATHNLAAMNLNYYALPPVWGREFDDWLAKTLEQRNWESLLQYRRLAPYAQENHPTQEHLLPLFVALGAVGQTAQVKQLHRSYAYSVLSMAAYAFH
ncbi:MAG: class III extradiol ring-cleavage dioxygenase [Leptolyngbyaceae cyanobacterium MO_188.B28]|nr:class III extradiol ring-cleavage dioxygenase [Leptolyngbyaceae cyanobacterium MO_188.B28]